jgi:hypothetical protein
MPSSTSVLLCFDAFCAHLPSYQLKSQQDELERKLWEEKEAIHTKHTEKVKVANTK